MILSFKTNKPIDVVFDCLTDMEKFAAIHPIISKIEFISGSTYRVHETVRLGFIPFSFTYPVSIEKNDAAQKIVFRAVVFRLTKIDMVFHLMSQGPFTYIEEEIRFVTPLPIKSILRKVFKEQHEKLFENIDAA
jgi:carbon monoxide dehydrogenase subunit G